MPYENGMYVSPTRTVTERQPEWIQDGIDPAFDFESFAKECIERMSPKPTVEQLVGQWKKYLEDAAKPNAFVTDDGGWPRAWWNRAYKVGMAAQWPYWTPRPVVACESSLGGSQWMDFNSITGAMQK